MRMRHLAPVKSKFDVGRFNEITQEDCYPTHIEIENSYTNLLLSKDFDFLCGDVLEIISKENDYELYYFVSANGLELIGSVG